jgi:hypothetical protein
MQVKELELELEMEIINKNFKLKRKLYFSIMRCKFEYLFKMVG